VPEDIHLAHHTSLINFFQETPEAVTPTDILDTDDKKIIFFAVNNGRREGGTH